jgi:hypothetical protein
MNILQRLKIYNIAGLVASFVILVLYLFPSFISEKNTLLNFSGTIILITYTFGIIELFRRKKNFLLKDHISTTLNEEKSKKPTVIKFFQSIKNLQIEKNYFILNKTSNKIQIDDYLLKLKFIGNSLIDGLPVFEMTYPGFVKVNNSMNFEIFNTSNDTKIEKKLNIASFINDNGYMVVESDDTSAGNLPKKDEKGNYSLFSGIIYYKNVSLIACLEDHIQNSFNA